VRDSAGATIVSELSGEQFDLNWCSVGCLRVWFLELLDRVESAAGPPNPPGAAALGHQ
jgi:hypothetical protein